MAPKIKRLLERCQNAITVARYEHGDTYTDDGTPIPEQPPWQGITQLYHDLQHSRNTGEWT